jgi:hypothetical protein
VPRCGYEARGTAPITRIVVKPGRLVIVGKGALLGHSIALTPDRIYRALHAPTAPACPPSG